MRGWAGRVQSKNEKAANRKNKQKKPGGGTRPRGRRDSLNLRRRTAVRSWKGNESFLPPYPEGERESGPPFPSASLAETADGSLTLAREESPTSRASQVPHSHSFSGGGPTAKAQAGPNFEDVHPSKAIIVHARL